MLRFNTLLRLVGLASLAACVVTPVARADEVVNVYTTRHYDSDDALYRAFEENTGIRVNLIEGDADQLLARIDREGDLSPADVFVTVDAGNLHQAVEAGVLQPVESDVLSDRIPSNLRHPDGLWFGLSRRVRVAIVSPDFDGTIATYEDLADDTLGDALLVRSSKNIYNQSLLASLIANEGEAAATQWARGIVDNLARRPAGGDRDQIRGVAAGEGDVAIANHYYFARMLDGNDAADREAASKLTLVFPDQDGRGAHVNVSGAGVVETAPNRDNAVKLLEYLTTPDAQRMWAVLNYEYPVVDGVELPPVLERFGEFKADDLNASALGEHNAEAVRIMDRVGWR